MNVNVNSELTGRSLAAPVQPLAASPSSPHTASVPGGEYGKRFAECSAMTVIGTNVWPLDPKGASPG